MAERKRATKTRRRERKNVPSGHAHIQAIVQQHDRDHHRPRLARPIAWGSAGAGRLQGLAQEHALRRRAGADGAAKRAMEHGMRQIEVFVKGPGAGSRAGHPLAPGRRPGGHRHHRRHPHPAQRLPPAQAAPGLGPHHGSLQRTRLPPLPPGGHEALPQGQQAATPRSAPSSAARTPPGQHGVRRRKMSDYGIQLREKQKIRRVYMVWSASSGATSRPPSHARA